MILPSTYIVSILLVIASMLCWGSWANLYKATGKWRFELFYLDFAVGVLLVGFLCALTFGTLGWDGFSFIDDVRIAGKRQELYAFLAGAVFNLGNILLVGAISLAGISVAFPIGLGFALVIGIVWTSILSPVINPGLLVLGCVAVGGAVLCSILSFKGYRTQRLMARIREGKTKSTSKTISLKPVIVALAAGVLIGSFYPLLELARSDDSGLGPYSLVVIFALGMFMTTFVYNLFLMNLPIQGDPVELGDYLRGGAAQHLKGLAAGGLWTAGTVASFVAVRTGGAARVNSAVIYGMAQAATAIGTLWGLFYWKEFAGAEPKVRTFLILMVVLLVVGVSVVSVAPVYGKP